MGAFLVPLDIANRALDHCGAPPITSFIQDAKAAQLVARIYDKVRVAEMRRNTWRFGIRKTALRPVDSTSMFLAPAAYAPADTYPQGAVVTSGGVTYHARQAVPVATAPGTPNEAYWSVYFGPLSVSAYDPTIAYYSGELVYVLTGTTVVVYRSLQSANSDNPATVAAYSPTTVYFKGDTVTESAVTYQSKIDLNLNQDPATITAAWGVVPGLQPDQMQGQNWMKLDATLSHTRIDYPLGAGPRDQPTTRNAYRLPSGYLRKAPQTPKAGSSSYLGAPSGAGYDDWEFNGDWIVTSDVAAIVFRFAADVADVSTMDPMFCEALACRIALEVCEPLTQSGTKLTLIGSQYKAFMGEARVVNGIEEGSEEPPLDDWIACRF